MLSPFVLPESPQSCKMVDDVRLAANGACPVEFYGRTGGMVPGVKEIYQQIQQMDREHRKEEL